MCGIYASIATHISRRTPSCALQQFLRDRGPDHIEERQAYNAPYNLSFIGTVLSLRGASVTPQPFSDPKCESIFCWNGEAWKVGGDSLRGNDGEAIFDLLTRHISAAKTAIESTAAVLKVLRSLSGPFAFVLLDNIHSHLYFGRDRLGRRSLLYSTDNCPESMEFASVADPTWGLWKEVDCGGIYQLSLREGEFEDQPQDPADHLLSTSLLPARKHLWVEKPSLQSVGVPHTPVFVNLRKGLIYTQYSIGAFNRTIPMTSQWLHDGSRPMKELRGHLFESLKLRILDIPAPPKLDEQSNVRLAILFSGGLDCSVLARLAHDILPVHDIDLLNVAFENPRVLKAASSKKSVETGATATLTSVEGEVSIAPKNSSLEKSSPYEACPDRRTGRGAFEELQATCPTRTWRFVAINIPYEEAVKHRQKVIDLMRPHDTEMDLSIAYALYFAARGSGMATTEVDPNAHYYTSPARVLLSGLGADELFGGYTRHATAYRRDGFSGLLDELELDINRLGKRNLGRDDRIISHWGREPRFPYLDESLVKWAIESPVWDKCGFHLAESQDLTSPEMDPGKRVLRVLALELGMGRVALEKKRAIQFGARTANMGSEKRIGTALVT